MNACNHIRRHVESMIRKKWEMCKTWWLMLMERSGNCLLSPLFVTVIPDWGFVWPPRSNPRCRWPPERGAAGGHTDPHLLVEGQRQARQMRLCHSHTHDVHSPAAAAYVGWGGSHQSHLWVRKECVIERVKRGRKKWIGNKRKNEGILLVEKNVWKDWKKEKKEGRCNVYIL